MKGKKFRALVIDLYGKEYGARRWFAGVVGADEKTLWRWFTDDVEVPKIAVVTVELMQQVKKLTGKTPMLD